MRGEGSSMYSVALPRSCTVACVCCGKMVSVSVRPGVHTGDDEGIRGQRKLSHRFR
jgi:hypothetical protein